MENCEILSSAQMCCVLFDYQVQGRHITHGSRCVLVGYFKVLRPVGVLLRVEDRHS